MSDIQRIVPKATSNVPVVSISDFRALVAQNVVALDVQAKDADRFQGRMSSNVFEDIHFLGVQASEHSVHRTAAHVARATEGYVKFSLINSGGGMIVQDHRETVLPVGSMAIYDTDRPYSLFLEEGAHMSCVMFPKSLLGIPSDILKSITAIRLGGGSGAGAVVSTYLNSLAVNATELRDRVGRSMFRSAVGVIGTLLESAIDVLPSVGRRENLMLQILDFIDENLSDPELGPNQIASAHYMSVRNIQGMFSDQGTTVSNVIRTKRLERCYDELANPFYEDRTVASIAMSNGFVDAAHFSRAFRAQYGTSPGSIRPRTV